MKVSEFSKTLQDFFSDFFGSEAESEVFFGSGEFLVVGYLKPSKDWTAKCEECGIPLYEIKITFEDDYSPKPVVTYIDLHFLGEDTEVKYNLNEAIIYIEEKLATVKSKAIYENL